MAGEFWRSDRQSAAISPLLPTNQPGARLVDDRRVISGIVHMLICDGCWQECPVRYGPSTTIYNGYHRWSGAASGRACWPRWSRQRPAGCT
jgi:transposase